MNNHKEHQVNNTKYTMKNSNNAHCVHCKILVSLWPNNKLQMNTRKGIGIFGIVLIALIVGEFLKNVKVGLVIGLIFGLLVSGLIKSRRS